MFNNTYGFTWPVFAFVRNDIDTTVRGTIKTLQIIDISTHQKTWSDKSYST